MPFITQGKTNIKYILIIIILAAIIGGGILGYTQWWIGKQEKKLTEFLELKIPKKVEDGTVNWKIYTSSHSIFTLKYPSELYETKEHISLLFAGWKDEGVLSTKTPWNASFTDEKDFRIGFVSGPKKSTETLEDFIEKTIKEQSGEFYSPEYIAKAEKKTIQVDGRNSLWYVGSLGPGAKHIEVYIPKSETEVVVASFWYENFDQPPSEYHQKILQQILSTFKFIELEKTSKKEDTCVNSGGTVETSLCCESASDFPNLCLIGACGCSPENSHQIKTCDCGEGKCFDGTECITSQSP